jgi:hypothetical protein
MPGAHVSYVGFKSLPKAREYTLRVTQTDGSSQDFQLAVSNDAFLSRHVRYQDAPEICFLKLQRAVVDCEPGQPAVRQDVTAVDIEAYRLAHVAKASGRRVSPPAVSGVKPVAALPRR